MEQTAAKEKAIKLRQEGYSFKQIATELKIAKSTSHAWTKAVILSPEASEVLHQRYLFGQEVSRSIQNDRYIEKLETIRVEQSVYLDSLRNIPDKLICAMIYWCEGAKAKDGLKFTNSDPDLIKTFLKLFRNSFEIDETKLRAVVHIHEYHDDERQREFWSRVTHIPTVQFWKSYIKPHTGKNKKENYPGCISISYFNADIAKELLFLASAFMKNHGGVV